MDSKNDSHYPNDKASPQAPLRQHHRLATGENVNGESNPHGAESGPKDKRVGNAPCNY